LAAVETRETKKQKNTYVFQLLLLTRIAACPAPPKTGNTCSSQADADTSAPTPYTPPQKLLPPFPPSGVDDVAQTVEVIEAGYNVVILDNLHNSSTEALRRIEAIVGKSVPFENVDLINLDAVRGVFKKYEIDSVIHFAALKVPPQENPPKCYWISGWELIL
jgi:NAD dependent epimerase/dehydratase family